MKIWIERGEVMTDDPDGIFYAVSLGHDLFSYSISGVLSAFVEHEKFCPTGRWRKPSKEEKELYRKYRNFDINSILNATGWQVLEVRQNEKPD